VRAVLACGALLVCLAAGSLFLASRGDSGSPAAATKPSAKATLSSRSVLFGDTVEARVDLVVPHRLASLAFRGHPNFRPFRILASHVDRSDLGGGLERVSLRYTLACLSRHCLGAGPSLRVRFGPTSFSLPGGGRVSAVWPPLLEVSRVQDVSHPVTDGLNSGPVSIPGLQPRSDFRQALGAAGGALVVLLAAWLYVRLRIRRRVALAARQLSVLQTLLSRVEEGLPEDVIYRQRHALDALAVELRHRHIDGSLVTRAERLAWAPEEPTPAEIRTLCAQVRKLAKT